MRLQYRSILLNAGQVLLLSAWCAADSCAADPTPRAPALLRVPAETPEPSHVPAPFVLGQTQGFADPLLKTVQPRQPSQATLVAPPAPPAETDLDPTSAPPIPPAPGAPAAPFDLQQLNTGLDVRPLSQTSFDLTPPYETPSNPAGQVFHGVIDQRGHYGWVSPMLSCHTAYVQYHPLYFEEVNLERYGYSFGCFQPLFSAAHFYGTLPFLPYKMTDSPPCSYDINLEFAPAATAAPPVPPCRKPFNPKAAAVQSAVVAGAILLFP